MSTIVQTPRDVAVVNAALERRVESLLESNRRLRQERDRLAVLNQELIGRVDGLAALYRGFTSEGGKESEGGMSTIVQTDRDTAILTDSLTRRVESLLETNRRLRDERDRLAVLNQELTGRVDELAALCRGFTSEGGKE